MENVFKEFVFAILDLWEKSVQKLDVHWIVIIKGKYNLFIFFKGNVIKANVIVIKGMKVLHVIDKLL